MHLIGAARRARVVGLGKCKGGVGHYDRIKTQIAGAARTCFDRVAGADADNHNTVHSTHAQPSFQSAIDKSVGDIFLDYMGIR